MKKRTIKTWESKRDFKEEVYLCANKVKVKVKKMRNNFGSAEIVELIAPSPTRVTGDTSFFFGESSHTVPSNPNAYVGSMAYAATRAPRPPTSSCAVKTPYTSNG